MQDHTCMPQTICKYALLVLLTFGVCRLITQIIAFTWTCSNDVAISSLLNWPAKERTWHASGEHFWRATLARLRSRVEGWPWAELGLHFATVAYNTYIVPILAFAGQTAAPTEEVREAEPLEG